MATTAGEILARVQALGYGTDTETSQLLMLNMVHKRIINARRWSFLGAVEGSLVTAVGSKTVELDTLGDSKRVDAVRLVGPTGDGINLEHISPESIRDREVVEQAEGIPEYWSVIGQQLHIYPIPTQVYTIKVDTALLPNEITKAADTIQIPDSHSDILVWGTIMAITFRERDPDSHNFARQMYSELYTEMLSQFGMTDRQTPKHVVESGWYDDYELREWQTFA